MNGLYTVVPLTALRKVIAARMTEAVQTIPHFHAAVDLEVDALIAARRKLSELDGEARVSLNDLLIKACASALMDVPNVNIQWVNGEIHQYRSADISVVTAVEGGLATPILRNAESKSIWEISRDAKDLARRAAANKLKMQDILGGSFSISNLGMYGVDEFDAIINPPQCAILAIGCAKPRYVCSNEGEGRVAKVLRATLSVDHRALDGAAAAAFLSALRTHVEQPQSLLSAITDDRAAEAVTAAGDAAG